MNLNVLLKLEKLTWAHADFANIIYKTLDICSQHKKKKKKRKKKPKTLDESVFAFYRNS